MDAREKRAGIGSMEFAELANVQLVALINLEAGLLREPNRILLVRKPNYPNVWVLMSNWCAACRRVRLWHERLSGPTSRAICPLLATSECLGYEDSR